MAQTRARGGEKKSGDARSGAAAAPGAPRLPLWAWLGGAASLVGACGASGALVWNHFTGRYLPGCGPQSGCASIENHPMGRFPLPGTLAEWAGFAWWPASFLGFTFFAAVLAAWVVLARRVPVALRVVVWLGVGASVVYVGAIVHAVSGGKAFCQYCVASHAANFLLLAFMEVGVMAWKRSMAAGSVGRLGRGGWLVPAAVGAAVFFGASGALAHAERGKVSRERAASEAARAEAERALIEQAERARAQQPAREETWNFGPQGFTGRWRQGPEQAQVRIVIISGYQCPQCKRIEGEAQALRAKHGDRISLSHKHYVYNADCNKYLNGATLHSNGCWAARAAETAGILRGNEGFWQMHKWLFERGGGFTDDVLNAALVEMGYDPKVFIPVMMSDGSLRPVLADIDEAFALGISGTPMVVINGIEFKGWEAPRALERTVEALLATNPPAATSANDRPVLAREKYVADWRDETVRAQPADSVRRVRGAADAPVEVVVYGDLQEPNTAKIDAQLREWIDLPADRGGKPIRYVFRHYPGDKSCNSRLPRTFFEHGCLTARAAEAAGLLGGDEAYWKMHVWLLSHAQGMGMDAVRRGAAEVGLDADALVSALIDPRVNAAIQEDIAAAVALGVGQIPCIYVNGKFVKRWWRENDNVMERIVDEAAATAR